MNKDYQYINSVAGNTVIPVPSVGYDDVLYLMREGVGIRLDSAFTTGTINADVWRFSLKYKKSLQNNSGELFRVASFGNRVSTYTLRGSNPATEGNKYVIVIFGKRISYQVQSGDSVNDIIENLSNGINAEDYGTWSASSSFSGDRFTVTTNLPYNITTDTVVGDNYIFKTGDYAVINALSTKIYLLLYVNESNSSYLDHEELQSSYAYDNLTKFSGPIWGFLNDSGYHMTAFPLPSIYRYSTTDITDAPFFPSTSSRAVLDEINNQIVFSPQSPLLKNERINLLYK